MKKLGLLFVMLFMTNLIIAQRTISGKVTDQDDGSPLPGVNVVIKGTTQGTITDFDGKYQIKVENDAVVLVFSYVGYINKEETVGTRNIIDIAFSRESEVLEEVVVTAIGIKKEPKALGYAVNKVQKESITGNRDGKSKKRHKGGKKHDVPLRNDSRGNTEGYDVITDNQFQSPAKNPLSTFSIDVDRASYSNVRRFLNSGQEPPKDAVRIEEFINYFNYDYPQPEGKEPFSINTEVASCPWNSEHKLLHIGLQGKDIAAENLPASNLVFLLDVSGSMSNANKLPLLKSAFRMLVNKLRAEDHVSIVVYAGAAGLVLKPTAGNDKATILAALDKLNAGGSTAGGAGIELAYKTAMENFVQGGNNRVILATDGDFNVGASSNAEMVRLIEEKRKSGVFLTCLGFGMGNYKDSKMEQLANKGNGNYSYIDNTQEAKKVLINEFGGTMFTIAKDVKLQLEFNPTKVQAYRLIGYENRMLEAEDFENDKKDAGELGSGHTVTAIYEIIPVGVKDQFTKKIPKLKYTKSKTTKNAETDELVTVKFRYKKPDGIKSKLLEHVVVDQNVAWENTSNNFRFSAAVAAFGMLLRDSEFIQRYSYEDVIKLAQGAKGKDEEGYRAGFIQLVKLVPKLN